MADGKLEYCINSLLNQTIDDYEIIAVDDCSTDDSYDCLKKYMEKHPDKFVAIKLPENMRQGGAKNKGLELAQGEFIGFIDSDDWILPNMYEKLVCAAEKESADIAACHLCLVNEHTMEPTKAIPSITPELAGEITANKFRDLIRSFGALVTKIYKRDIFFHPELKFPEHMFYEDSAVGVEILSRAKKIALVDEPMYFYLQNSSSTTHTLSEDRCKNRMESMRIMLKYAIDGNYLDPFFSEIEYKFTELFYRNTLFSYMQAEGKKNIKFIKSLASQMEETFPNFRDNAYYLRYSDAEERKLMELCIKNTTIFVLYYKLLWGYRKFRAGKK